MSEATQGRDHWRLCSICKKPIAFGSRYYRCSVSTCNRKRTALSFCSVACWDAHVPTLRHRDAWAEEQTAPSREAWETMEQERVHKEQLKTTRRIARPGASELESVPLPHARRDDLPRDILVVVSKLKAYIKARGGMRTSDGVTEVLSDILRDVCDEAIRRAREDERQTVLDRDIPPRWRPE